MLATLCVAFVATNLRGESGPLWQGGGSTGKPDVATWLHGWPTTYLIRLQAADSVGGSEPSTYYGPMPRWVSLCDRNLLAIVKFSIGALLLNIAIALFIWISVFRLTSRWPALSRSTGPFQFSLRTLLLMPVVVSVSVLGVKHSPFDIGTLTDTITYGLDSFPILHGILRSILWLGVVCTVCVVGYDLRRLVGRRIAVDIRPFRG